MYTSLVLIHICTAVIGLLSGGLAMIFRKGSTLHRIAGNFFFGSMMVMAGAGAYLAEFLKPNKGNLMGGMLTLYVVATGWVAGKRRERRVTAFDWIALSMIVTLCGACLTWGMQARLSPGGMIGGYPPGLFFMFATITGLFALSDIRMVIRRGVAGADRIVRHVWRMCLALLFALFSFYPSRAHLFSKAVNDSHVMYIPHLLLLGSMFYWAWRTKSRKREQKNAVTLELANAAIAQN